MSILDGPGKKEKTEAKSYGEFHCKKKWKNKKKFIKQFNKTQKKNVLCYFIMDLHPYETENSVSFCSVLRVFIFQFL